MNKTISLLSCLGISCFLPAVAGEITVVNENEKPLYVTVQAEGSKVTENLAKYKKTVPAGQKLIFNLDETDLGGKTLFSVNGATHTTMPGSTCKDLSPQKKYTLTFTNDTMGTTCVAVPMGEEG